MKIRIWGISDDFCDLLVVCVGGVGDVLWGLGLGVWVSEIAGTSHDYNTT